MKKLIFTLLVAVFSISNFFAQNDTVFFNKSWQETEKSQSLYYRLPLVPSDEGFLIRDFYISGQLQMEGISLSQDSDDYQGKVTWYHENGKISQTACFDKGIRQGECIIYNTLEIILSKCIYKDDIPFEGSIYYMNENFSQIFYYSNGEAVNSEFFDNKSDSKAKVIGNYNLGTSDYQEVSYYSQNGDFLGKSIIKDGEVYDGISVEYTYNPMAVASIKNISEGVYKSPFTYYYSDGSVKKKTYFLNNNYDVCKEVYYEQNGKIIDSLFLERGVPLKGKKIEFFDSQESKEADKIEEIEYYKGGELNGISKSFYPNGKIYTQVNFKDGQEDGNKVTYDSTGNILYTLSYEDGEPWTGTYNDEDNIKTYENGILKEEKKFYKNGALFYILTSEGQEIYYDTTGNELARLQYKDKLPFEGKKLNVYYGEISSEETYSKGVLRSSKSYNNDGTFRLVYEYDNEGNQTREIIYYPDGKIQSDATFQGNGYKESIVYFDMEEKQLGELKIDEENDYYGDEYTFDGNTIIEHNLYDRGKVIRNWKYDDGKLISDIQRDGISSFYDIKNNKTYECMYKDMSPFEGTMFAYDTYNNGITELVPYKNGMMDGEYFKFEYLYDDEDLAENGFRPVNIITYKEDKKEGLAREFYQGKLTKTMIYMDDELNGELRMYDKEGKVITTVVYKDDYPFEGTLYEMDSYNEVTATTIYHNGNLDGEQKYFENKTLVRTEEFKDGIILKKTTVSSDKTYELNYKEGSPYSGKEIEDYSIYEYTKGELTSIKTYTDEELSQLESLETFKGNKSMKETYFENGKKKEVLSFVDDEKEGEAVSYNKDGKAIAKGNYQEEIPVSGKFIYYNKSNESDYILVEINTPNFTSTEYIDGKESKKIRFSMPASHIIDLERDLDENELLIFLYSTQLFFKEYEIEDDL